MWILLLLFSSLSFSDDDFSSERYCFSSPDQATTALQRFSAVQVPSDKVTKESQCLVIQMRPHRRELIQKYILTLYPETKIDFSSAEIKREPCKLKVQKTKAKNISTDTGELGSIPVFQDTTTSQSQSEEMRIETLNDFALSVDQDEVRGQCKFIRPDLYSITIEVRRNPKPIVPVNLPPGSIVVLEKAPSDQETSFLKTQVQLSRGEKIELGGIIRDLKNKDQNIDIKHGLKIETTSKDSLEQVFLSLD
jgi:hypothetical protein